ncbi:MAG: hypothetical protein MR487_00195 [Lachnospiraceae bacterium]|nr:hypothetical protein [Lachnospiraceae bacterium]
MKSTFEKNSKVQKREPREQRIIRLYQQILQTGKGDEDYRGKLVKELLHLQKIDGSFSLIDDYRCDSDIRVFYVYFPTYYATASLMYVTSLDGMTDELHKVLQKGLAFAQGRHLVGHGFDAIAQQLEAIRIYKDAGLYDWMRVYQDDYAEFSEMIKNIMENYRQRLLTGHVIDDWQVDFSKQFQKKVDEYDAAFISNIWYAAYGSNINSSRFMQYIADCADQTPPVQSRAVRIPYDIYFAYKSRRWNRKGVAFLDDTHEGMSLGRMYLITGSQFADIQKMEGSIYRKKILLGTENGIPIYTFTSPEKRTDMESPDISYLETILQGLKETYQDMSELVLSTYLFRCGVLNDDDMKVLSYIRHSAHGVSLETISEHTIAITRVRKSIKKLISYQLIRQDGQNQEEGHVASSPEAVMYTRKPKRELIDLLLLDYR